MSIEQDEKVHFNKCNLNDSSVASSFWIDAEIMLLKPDELPLISDMQTHTSENLEPANDSTTLYYWKNKSEYPREVPYGDCQRCMRRNDCSFCSHRFLKYPL